MCIYLSSALRSRILPNFWQSIGHGRATVVLHHSITMPIRYRQECSLCQELKQSEDNHTHTAVVHSLSMGNLLYTNKTSTFIYIISNIAYIIYTYDIRMSIDACASTHVKWGQIDTHRHISHSNDLRSFLSLRRWLELAIRRTNDGLLMPGLSGKRYSQNRSDRGNANGDKWT